MNPPIIDLHCDLLCYLAGSQNHSPYDDGVRCSIPQLQAGNVKLQILPIYTLTEPDSSKKGGKQLEAFQNLPKPFQQVTDFSNFNDSIGVILAYENASGFCSEEDPLDESLKTLDRIGKIAYISLTWNMENRFGGGALTSVGLKDDGKRLLDYMHGKRIAIDFSHTSDPLAYSIFEHIDTHQLDIPVMASHSNFRTVTDVPRNLPDDIAKEIIKRKGVIGINFLRRFIGSESTINFAKQLQHGLGIGGEQAICLGADFFFDDDLPPEHRRPADELFFPTVCDASCYGKVIEIWKEHCHLNTKQLQRITHENALHYLQSQIL